MDTLTRGPLGGIPEGLEYRAYVVSPRPITQRPRVKVRDVTTSSSRSSKARPSTCRVAPTPRTSRKTCASSTPSRATLSHPRRGSSSPSPSTGGPSTGVERSCGTRMGRASPHAGLGHRSDSSSGSSRPSPLGKYVASANTVDSWPKCSRTFSRASRGPMAGTMMRKPQTSMRYQRVTGRSYRPRWACPAPTPG